MFGKGKDKTNPSAPPVPTVPVTAIPAEFYAGANPVVTFKEVKKELAPPGSQELSAAEKKKLDAATMVGSSDMLHPASLLANWKFLLAVGGGIVALGALSAGGYYWWIVSRPPETLPVAAVPPLAQPEPLPPPPAPEPIVSEPEPEPEPAPELPGAQFALPSLLLPDGTDTDGDGLSDAEEELFRTDIALADSDQDKFTDAHEVYNLYDPAAVGPVTLLFAGVAKEFVNPVFNYSFYYPATWAVASVDDSYQTVLVSTITGEFIEVRVFKKSAAVPFEDWLATEVPAQRLSGLAEFATMGKKPGMRRQDYLVYYFVEPTTVYAIVYHPFNSSAVNFRSVIKMIARSFRPGPEVEINFPEQYQEGGPVGASPAATVSSSPMATTTAATATSSGRSSGTPAATSSQL